MSSKYLLSGWKKDCMPSRFFSGSCEVTAIKSGRISADLAALLVSAWHPSCCLPEPPRALSGAEGHGGTPEPPFSQAGQGGHLKLPWHTASTLAEMPPLSSSRFSFSSSSAFFPSVNYFRIVPSGPIIMILNFEISARHSEYSWPSSVGAIAEEMAPDTCHCPCFILSGKSHVSPDNLWPWPWACNKMIASSHPFSHTSH